MILFIATYVLSLLNVVIEPHFVMIETAHPFTFKIKSVVDHMDHYMEFQVSKFVA